MDRQTEDKIGVPARPAEAGAPAPDAPAVELEDDNIDTAVSTPSPLPLGPDSPAGGSGEVVTILVADGDEGSSGSPEEPAPLTPAPGGDLSNASPFIVRHRLLAPVCQILGLGELLQDEANGKKQVRLAADLKRIVQSARELQRVIDELTAGAAQPALLRALAEQAPSSKSVRESWSDAGPLSQLSGAASRHSFLPPEECAIYSTGPESVPAKLLVVDDERVSCQVVAPYFRAQGYHVDIANSGAEALGRLEEQPFNLVLLDVLMSELSGFDVLRQIRQKHSMTSLPVIMMTALDDSEHIVQALELGANDYVVKPLDFPVVLARVATQLSLTQAREEVSQLNRRLEAAEAHIAGLVESAGRATQDLVDWCRYIAPRIARAIGAEHIAVWTIKNETLRNVVDAAELMPPIEDVRFVAEVGKRIKRKGYRLLPVRGHSENIFGVLGVCGANQSWNNHAKRLVYTFARQLGTALEFRRMRRELEEASERHRKVMQRMMDRAREPSVITEGLMPDGEQPPVGPRVTVVGGPLHKDMIAQRYRLLDVIAEGGMGRIYQAQDMRLNRKVAVKTIRSEYFYDDLVRERFKTEARVVGQLDHPAVVSVHDSGELPDGGMYIVMEWLNGRDLRELLSACGPGTPAQVARVVREGSAGLYAAHRAGLVHRDIKPENVYLIDDGQGFFRVKIVDFGVVKDLRADKQLTRTGVLIGTPAFMPPEQCAGEPVDARSDLYSFAAVAYEALTGRRVTTSTDLAETIKEVLQVTPPSPSTLVEGCPKELDEIFMAALAKNPADRPRDIRLWGTAVADLLMTIPSKRRGWVTSRGELDVYSLVPSSELI